MELHPADRIVHIHRMQQEILFQLMIKEPAFKNIPVGVLRDFCDTAVIQVNSYESYFNKHQPDNILKDSDFNRSTFIISMLMER